MPHSRQLIALPTPAPYSEHISSFPLLPFLSFSSNLFSFSPPHPCFPPPVTSPPFTLPFSPLLSMTKSIATLIFSLIFIRSILTSKHIFQHREVSRITSERDSAAVVHLRQAIQTRLSKKLGGYRRTSTLRVGFVSFDYKNHPVSSCTFICMCPLLTY